VGVGVAAARAKFGEIPEAVFELLAIVWPLFPQLEFVIFERIGNTLTETSAQEQFRRDYHRMVEIIHAQP
jgi:hypothetical protein